MRESKPILQINDISCNYGDELILQDIHFSLQRGEILCLLGRSGSGKTSLLRLIAGLEKPQSGTILFNGFDTDPIPAHKRGFGMMFQEYALFPHKNVEQNICFGLEMKKLSRDNQLLQVAKMLELVGLTGLEKGDQMNFQGVNNSGWPWPDVWPLSLTCFCSMNHWGPWTGLCGIDLVLRYVLFSSH